MRSLIGRDPVTQRCIEVQIEGEYISNVREVKCDVDSFIASAFVDLQVNGYRGIDLNANDCSPEAVLRLTRLLAEQGTATFLPTIITASHAAMVARLRDVATACRMYPEVQMAVPGIHIEGPWISPLDGYRGAHPLADVRPISLDEFDKLQEAALGSIRLVTMSPHWPDSVSVIRALCARDVVVALGHTHASPEQIKHAVATGARLCTHLGNGLPTAVPRHHNQLWIQLADDGLMSTFIADGIHLPSEVLQTMLRAKGLRRSILISDSVALAGSEPGEYHSHIGGAVTVRSDGSIWVQETEMLAGSGISLKEAVARAPQLGQCSLGDAVQMATKNPVRALGLRRRLMRVGCIANLVIFRWSRGDRTLDMREVVVHGSAITS